MSQQAVAVLAVGMVGGAAALYTMWKLLPTPEEDQGDLEYNAGYRPRPTQIGVVGESYQIGPSSGRSLQEVLEEIVDTKLSIGGLGNEQDQIREISGFVASEFRKSLKSRCRMVNIPEFKFPKEVELIGSSSDGTKIPGKGDCDYLLHINVPERYTPTIFHMGEGYWRICLDNFRLNDPMIRMTTESCLSPLEVHAFLMGRVESATRRLNGTIVTEFHSLYQLGIKNVRHVSQQAGPSLKLEITYKRNGKTSKFDMDLVPCFTIMGKQLVGKRHPDQRDLHQTTRGYRNHPETLRWRQSYSTTERDRIRSLNEDGGYRKEVYQLVKYLRYNHQQFRHFNPFIYKTVFLYLLDGQDKSWDKENLADRFMDYMRLLERFFNDRQLNHYYLLRIGNKERNLLKPNYDDTEISDFYNFLRSKNESGGSTWAEILENTSQD